MRKVRLASSAAAGLILLALAACHHSTGPNPPSNSIPNTGSVFTYADTGISVGGGLAFNTEKDTVLASGISVWGKTNVLQFGPSARIILNYSITQIDSSVGISIQTEGFAFGPPYISSESSGDVSMPAILTISSTDTNGYQGPKDSTMQWLTFPLASRATVQLFSPSEQKDSVVSAENVTLSVNGVSIDCEHAIDYHSYQNDTLQGAPPSKVDLYYSSSLGVPVLTTLSIKIANGYQILYTKRLISFTN